ncbi:unnamed protein product [Leptidea sinapis]|uniref:XRN2-binding (XTBD) domain-containing protein n=1 Tax=Leptidea sinapis TaxID=189913 RepID=A0A5E4QBJ1_9NEOP|nr:unnamed protein product [Leptidea sinapis]
MAYFDGNWDVDKYREEHESDQHWLLRKAFMERWKYFYSEERLVCLARVFTNIGFLGCKYPMEIMQEVSALSKELIALQYNSDRALLLAAWCEHPETRPT